MTLFVCDLLTIIMFLSTFDNMNCIYCFVIADHHKILIINKNKKRTMIHVCDVNVQWMNIRMVCVCVCVCLCLLLYFLDHRRGWGNTHNKG
jgi:hypothetical protein